MKCPPPSRFFETCNTSWSVLPFTFFLFLATEFFFLATILQLKVFLKKWPWSADIISTNGKQDTAKHLSEATRGKHGFLCYIFWLWVNIKALLKEFPNICYCINFRIWIIVLTCPDNKSARNHQPKYSCVPAKSHKSQWCEANIISNKIFAPFQFVPVRVKTQEYHH